MAVSVAPPTGEKVFRPDWSLFLITLALLGFGIVMVFDASYPHGIAIHNDRAYWVKKQVLSAAIGLVALAVGARIPFWRWQRWALPALLGSLALLVAVHAVGHDAQGGQRWIGWGPFRIQPSEIAKLALVLYLSRMLAERSRQGLSFWTGYVPLLAVSLVAIVLVERQPDLGTAVTMLLTVLAVLYAAGARARWIIGSLLLFAALSLAVILSKGTENNYRWNRLTAFVNPEADPLNTGFQIRHSLLALGTGGVAGMGFGESREKLLGNLPAQRTDFIYAVIGEEFGLVGTLGVLAGFLILTARGLHIAQRTKDPFGALLATGITAMIGIQALLNIGVVTASIPTTGIPLPLISYGGSSLVSTLFSIGILLNISQRPFYRDRIRNNAGASPGPVYSGGSARTAKERLMALKK